MLGELRFLGLGGPVESGIWFMSECSHLCSDPRLVGDPQESDERKLDEMIERMK